MVHEPVVAAGVLRVKAEGDTGERLVLRNIHDFDLGSAALRRASASMQRGISVDESAPQARTSARTRTHRRVPGMGALMGSARSRTGRSDEGRCPSAASSTEQPS